MTMMPEKKEKMEASAIVTLGFCLEAFTGPSCGGMGAQTGMMVWAVEETEIIGICQEEH